MTMPSPSDPQGDGPKRMSTSVKLALMGVGAVALLYSCTPTVGAFRALPYFWGFGNPFYRPPIATTCPPGSPLSCEQQARSSSGGSSFTGSGRSGGTSTSGESGSSTTTSQRGGFGSTATAHGSGSSSS